MVNYSFIINFNPNHYEDALGNGAFTFAIFARDFALS
jgi:hypothetical protein